MSSFDLTAPHRFTTGTVGEPGRRVFYVQAAEGPATVTLKLEKAQVAALAGYLAELLADLPAVDEAEVPSDMDLAEPVVAEWVVGTIGVAADEAGGRLVVSFRELQPEADEGGEGIEGEDDDAGTATVSITHAQAMAFVRRAAELVAAGRPACVLCGRPIDPEGHVCIKTNGHLH